MVSDIPCVAQGAVEAVVAQVGIWTDEALVAVASHGAATVQAGDASVGVGAD